MTRKKKVTAGALHDLYVAAETNDVAGLQLWVDTYGAKNIDKCRDQYNRSALLEAAVEGRTQSVLFLLQAGANPGHAGSNGLTPLHAAVLGNKPAIIEALLEKGADIEGVWGDHTPLQQAVSFGNEEATRVLLKHGADVTRCDEKGKTVLDLIFNDMQGGITAAVSGEVSRVFGAEAERVCKEGIPEAVQPLKKIQLKPKS